PSRLAICTGTSGRASRSPGSCRGRSHASTISMAGGDIVPATPPRQVSLLHVYRDEIGTINRRIAMGAYCMLASIRRHPARPGEIMEVRRLFTYYDAAVFGDRDEIACIPHKGCLLEIVAAGEAAHPEVNRLLPGHVIRYTRSFFFGDRFELPSGTRVN